MTTARNELRTGARSGRDQDGDFVIRVFELLDITGATPRNLLLQALNDPLTPKFLDPHPDNGNIVVANVRVQPTNAKGPGGTCNSARVFVEYRSRARTTAFGNGQVPSSTGPAVKQYTSNLSTRRVETDRFGNPLVTRPFGETNPDNNVLQPVELSVVDQVYQFERLENDEATIEQRKENHEGTVNEFQIVGANITHGARTLLCTNITARSIDSGESWQVTYLFQKDNNTWDTTLTHKDESGIADKPQYDANNRITYQVPPVSDFSNLSLNW